MSNNNNSHIKATEEVARVCPEVQREGKDL